MCILVCVATGSEEPKQKPPCAGVSDKNHNCLSNVGICLVEFTYIEFHIELLDGLKLQRHVKINLPMDIYFLPAQIV